MTTVTLIWEICYSVRHGRAVSSSREGPAHAVLELHRARGRADLDSGRQDGRLVVGYDQLPRADIGDELVLFQQVNFAFVLDEA